MPPNSHYPRKANLAPPHIFVPPTARSRTLPISRKSTLFPSDRDRKACSRPATALLDEAIGVTLDGYRKRVALYAHIRLRLRGTPSG